jgi:hypothetical protein
MNKKHYIAPEVKRVRMDINNAVLSVCHSSNIGDSGFAAGGCRSVSCSATAPSGSDTQQWIAP